MNRRSFLLGSVAALAVPVVVEPMAFQFSTDLAFTYGAGELVPVGGKEWLALCSQLISDQIVYGTAVMCTNPDGSLERVAPSDWPAIPGPDLAVFRPEPVTTAWCGTWRESVLSTVLDEAE